MGAWKWIRVTETIEGLRLLVWERQYTENAQPKCEHCEDYGEWIGESGNVEPCPICKGANSLPPKKDTNNA